METVVEGRAEPGRDQLRRALAWQRDRRRWRHLAVAGLGAVATFLGEVGTVAILAGRGGSLGGHPRLPLYAALWAGGALLASLGWNRLRPGRALARLPLVALALAGGSIAMFVVAQIGPDNAGQYPSPNLSLPGGGSALAMALVDQDWATAMLGGAFTGPLPLDGFLIRSESMARLRSEKRALTVLVGRDPGGARRTAAPRGVQARSRSAWAWGGVGDWTIQMSLHGAGEDAAQLLTIALSAAERRLAVALAPA